MIGSLPDDRKVLQYGCSLNSGHQKFPRKKKKILIILIRSKVLLIDKSLFSTFRFHFRAMLPVRNRMVITIVTTQNNWNNTWTWNTFLTRFLKYYDVIFEGEKMLPSNRFGKCYKTCRRRRCIVTTFDNCCCNRIQCPLLLWSAGFAS